MKYALLALIFISGCVEIHPPRNKRYSVDITQLKQEELIKDTWVYRHPDKKPTDYKLFIFDSVRVYENTAKKIRKENRPIYDAFAERLTGLSLSSFKKDYDIAKQAGEGVLEIEISIVDIKPIVHYINKDGNEAIRYDGTAKGTKFEMDCVDSATREPILAISTLYSGEQYAAHENLAYLGNLEKAYLEWSRFFKNRFDQATKKASTPAPSPK
jgi:hypothetical protein